MNSYPAALSRGRPGRKLHFDAICTWAGVYSFSGALRVEVPEHAERENGVHCSFG